MQKICSNLTGYSVLYLNDLVDFYHSDFVLIIWMIVLKTIVMTTI